MAPSTVEPSGSSASAAAWPRLASPWSTAAAWLAPLTINTRRLSATFKGTLDTSSETSESGSLIRTSATARTARFTGVVRSTIAAAPGPSVTWARFGSGWLPIASWSLAVFSLVPLLRMVATTWASSPTLTVPPRTRVSVMATFSAASFARSTKNTSSFSPRLDRVRRSFSMSF